MYPIATEQVRGCCGPLSQLPRSDKFDELIGQIEESSVPELASNAENCCFVYKSDAAVKETQERVVPATMKKSTSWAVTVWTEWSKGQEEHFRNDPMELPPHLMVCRTQELDHWLSRFVIEAQRKDGVVKETQN